MSYPYVPIKKNKRHPQSPCRLSLDFYIRYDRSITPSDYYCPLSHVAQGATKTNSFVSVYRVSWWRPVRAIPAQLTIIVYTTDLMRSDQRDQTEASRWRRRRATSSSSSHVCSCLTFLLVVVNKFSHPQFSTTTNFRLILSHTTCVVKLLTPFPLNYIVVIAHV